MKKILMSLFTIAIVGTLITGGVIAVFSDTEEVGQNVFTAGTLDLKVNGSDGPIAGVSLANLIPGDYANSDGNPASCSRPEVEGLVWTVKNDGSINGNFWIEIVGIVNYENGQNEPEALVDATAGELEGELGRYLYFAYYINGNWKSCGSGINEFSSLVSSVSTPLAANQEVTVCIGWILSDRGPDIDNKYQSDGLEFSIIFHLDQA